ncbi:SusC/RagA family TonB-linked outer membrane protein [Carboxylicivirga sp. N1Y90]|uniref:SusC/RagA family TonB-linked outer membrane protein n=1 Tax=Carboxylicivirga fragile TaxID=3417571 RepID=UPI003D32C6B2|nr:TonB-dependent receptor [Marinilabiliaceae bacterium N1Y90]
MKKQCNLFKLLFLFLAMFSFLNVHAQEMAVTGVVTDATDGMPLPGVTVAVKGTTNGTITTPDGRYTLNLESGETLVFSFIGYKSQEILATSSSINIALEEDVIGMEEVVVIGYGTVKKEDATGSLIAVKADDFNQGAIASPQDLIVGKTSGVQITSSGGAPGAGSTIRIRGGASLSANNEPLFVIDGVPVSSDGINGIANPLATINPDDIETFTVLKDASATAIYGSRASNGVIIVTTKKGAKGQPLSVNYSGKFSVGATNNRVDVYGASEYRDLVNKLYGPDSNNPTPDAIAAMGEASTDWQDEIYQTAFGQDHNISLQGGLDFLPYRFSYGYNNQDGVLKTSNIERHALSLNLNPTFLDNHLKTALNVKTTFVKNSFANEGAIGAAVGMDPTQPVRNVYEHPNGEQWGGYWEWIDAATGLPQAFAPRNPLGLLEQQTDKSDVQRSIVNLSLDYKFHFLPEMSAVVNFGLDHSDSDGSRVVSPDAASEYENEDIRGIKTMYEQEKTNKVLDMYLKYQKTIGIHTFDVMGGYSWQHFKNEGYNFENDYYNYRDPATTDRPFAGENYLISYYGRFNYTLNDKYLVTGTIRRDGTSRFAEGNRWGTFPAFAFAWKMKEESFLKDVDVVSDLKLRFGWGITGQQDVTGNDYVGYGTYTLSDNGAMYIIGDQWYNTYRPNAYNPDLKWEETTSTNVGVDFALFNSRLSGSVDYYYRETTDLLNMITVAAGTSLSDRVVSNVGSLENQGVEVNLLGRIISKQDFYWELGGNLTYNRNEITKLTAVDDPNYVGVPSGDLGSGNFIQMNSVGKAVNSFYVYEQVYDQAGSPLEGVYVDQNGDGVINSDDRIYYGDSTPDYLIGINSTLRYKNWDFSLSGRFQLGAQIYNGIASGGANHDNVYNATTGSLSNKLRAGSETNFLYSDEQRDFSSHWIENADFFRLDNLSVGYSFDSVFGLEGSNLRLSLTGQNLWLVSDYSGLDPEVFNGIDNNIYPRPTTIMFGVNFGF